MSAADDVLAGINAYNSIKKSNYEKEAHDLTLNQAKQQADINNRLNNPDDPLSQIGLQGIVSNYQLGAASLPDKAKNNPAFKKTFDSFINEVSKTKPVMNPDGTIQMDENGNPKQTPVYSATQAKAIAEQSGLSKMLEDISKSGLSADSKLFSPFATVKQEQNEFSRHKDAVKEVMDDKPTQNLLNGYQSIGNALVEFKNNPSTQSFHTLQNTLRMNAGSGNRSGVSERASQYANSLGLNRDQVMQFLSGNPIDVNMSDPKLVDAYMQVAKGELDQKRSQAMQQIDKKANAFATVYKRPSMAGYKSDFDNVIQSQKDQFAPIDDLLGGSFAKNGPPGGHMSVQQNGHTYNWNAQTGKYE